jgi:glycosyltransferase involved in cell wall biosynthesis
MLSSTNPRSVLFVAFHYPPENSSSGVLRSLKFSKYLPKFGWTVDVLTVKQNVYTTIDQKLCGQIPNGVYVNRAGAFDSVKKLSICGKTLNVLAFPDKYISWYFDAVKKGKKIIKQKNIKVIFVTFRIPTAVLIGLTLKRKTKLPLIIEFRDHWVDETFKGIRRWVSEYLERKAIHAADKMIFVTHETHAHYKNKFPEYCDKYVVIPNGYDEDDFKKLPKENNNRPIYPIKIAHAGALYNDLRNPMPFLYAIHELIETNDIPSDHIRVEFIGAKDFFESSQIRQKILNYKLDGEISTTPRISHEESLIRLSQVDVLLIIQDHEITRQLIPAKLYECIRFGKRIMALTHKDGATGELLRHYNLASVIESGDIASIKRTLLRYYFEAKDQKTCKHSNSFPINKYSRYELTRSLSEQLAEFI